MNEFTQSTRVATPSKSSGGSPDQLALDWPTTAMKEAFLGALPRITAGEAQYLDDVGEPNLKSLVDPENFIRAFHAAWAQRPAHADSIEAALKLAGDALANSEPVRHNPAERKLHQKAEKAVKEALAAISARNNEASANRATRANSADQCPACAKSMVGTFDIVKVDGAKVAQLRCLECKWKGEERPWTAWDAVRNLTTVTFWNSEADHPSNVEGDDLVRRDDVMRLVVEYKVAQASPQSFSQLKSLPTVVWWNETDCEVVFNNANGASLIFRAEAMRILRQVHANIPSA